MRGRSHRPISTAAQIASSVLHKQLGPPANARGKDLHPTLRGYISLWARPIPRSTLAARKQLQAPYSARCCRNSCLVHYFSCFQQSYKDLEADMIDKIKSKISRRRAFFLLGLPVALGFAAAPTVMMSSDAEAQTAGMETRQERRTGRQRRAPSSAAYKSPRAAHRAAFRAAATQSCFGIARRWIARRLHLGRA